MVGLIGGYPSPFGVLALGLRTGATGIVEHGQNGIGGARNPGFAAIVQGGNGFRACKPSSVLAGGYTCSVGLGVGIIVTNTVHGSFANLGAASQIVIIGIRSAAAADNGANIGGLAGNGADAIAVGHRCAAEGQTAHHACGVALARYGAGIVAVRQGDAGVDIAHHTAAVVAAGRNSAFVIAVLDRGIVADIANHAANIRAGRTAGAGGGNGTGANHSAVFHRATGQSADHTGNILVTGEIGVLHSSILHCSCADIAKQANIAAVGLNSQIGNRMFLTVEDTGIVFAGIANGRPFHTSHINVSHQLAIDCIASVVDQCSKSHQVSRIIDFIIAIGVFGDFAVCIDHDLIIADSQAKLVVLLGLGYGEASLGRSGSQLLGADGGSGHGVLRRGSSRIGGASAVNRHGGDGSGPDILAHVANLDRQVSFFHLVIGQVVQFIGLAGKGRQIQVAVLAHHQRGEHVLHAVIAGQFQAQVTAGDVIQGVITHFTVIFQDSINPEVPNITVIVQQDKVLGIMNDTILVFNLLSAEGSNTDQVAAHGTQVEANGIQGHGVLSRQQIGIVDRGDHICLIGGEDFAVGHIPQRDLILVFRAGQQITVSIHLVHLLGLCKVHHVEGVLLGGPGCGGNGLNSQSGTGGPGVGLCHVPGVEGGIVILIDHSAVNGDLQQVHGDLTGSGLGGVQLGSGSDPGGAGCDTGNHAVFIHDGDAGIGAGPGNITVGSGPGLNIGDHLGRCALDGLNSALIQRNSADLVSGFGPAVGSAGLIGDHQAAHFVPEVIVTGELAGGGVDLVIICTGNVGTKINLNMGVPADDVLVGIVFHTHVALGTVAVT